MKLEIEIDETHAALIWADATWHGKYTDTLTAIIERNCMHTAAHVAHGLPKMEIERCVRIFKSAILRNQLATLGA